MANHDRRILMLERPVAAELHDLVADKPGTADEDLLEEALRSLRQANGSLSSGEQKLIAEGQAVAIEVEPIDLDAVLTLIREDRERHPKRLRRMAQRMRTKLRQARKKAGRR